MAAHFTPPDTQDNNDGWGPLGIPEQYKDLPYQPFSKMSEWTGGSNINYGFQDRKYGAGKFAGGAGGSQYAYLHDEEENSFQLVDTTRTQRPMYARGRFLRNQRMQRGRNQNQRNSQPVPLGKGGKLKDNRMRQTRNKWQNNRGRGNFGGRGYFMQQKNREASVIVQPSWKIIEEMDFPRLTKLSLRPSKDATDLLMCGELEYYDKKYDRVTVKNEQRLMRIDRIFHKVTTTDDPVIRRLAKTEGTVYATDSILATLMCSIRSNYSWDIIVQKVGGKLFFDKRDDSEFDLLTVSETSNEPPAEEGINSPRNLALEATFINHNFSQQVLKMGEEKLKLEEPNPFLSEDEVGEVASVAYRYRKWDLGGGVVLVARCEHDAVTTGSSSSENQYISIKALNEWDSRLSGGVEWRQKLDTQRGAVLANELKNNACKLAKWTVQALLANSDWIKFGYVSRMNLRDTSRHVILGTQQFRPADFASQINLNMENAWGILRCIIDLCMKEEDGKYLLVKDPNKPVIRLYKVPDNTFESDEEAFFDEAEEDQ